MLRILIRHAINIGWLKHDPSLGIKRPKIQAYSIWTEDEIETFRKRWPLGTKQRLAFELFLISGSAAPMWCGWRGRTSRPTARSGGATEDRAAAADPAHRDPLTALDADEREHIVDHDHRCTASRSLLTVSANGFAMPSPTPVFRSIASRMACARPPVVVSPRPGATAKMIMSILGHTTLAEAERYTEEADQAGLAEDAVIKLEGHKANRFAQTAPAGLGKAAKTKGKST